MAALPRTLESEASVSGHEPALSIRRGALRLLHTLGFSAVAEFPLPSGRRADLIALGGGGEFWIVEIKSCAADFRSDRKWQEYRLHCDRLLFAVSADFPAAMIPEDAGLMITDAYGGRLARQAPLHSLAAARRKSLLIGFGRAAAGRLQAQLDPGWQEAALI